MAPSEEQYDVIIVGGGTAGSVLAYRLSAYPHLSVLVLEAGEDRNRDPYIYTPGLHSDLLGDDKYDWRYTTEPEPGLNDRIINHHRGKVIGGSSAINSFVLVYPNRAGIDVWETLGNEGWGWAGLEPYFKKFQTVGEPPAIVREELSLAHKQDVVASTSGPLRTSFLPRVVPLNKAWIGFWRSINLDLKGDAFDGNGIGGHTCVCHVSADTNERTHAGEAYLMPVAHRSNLTIITGVTVEKVTFSTEGGKTTATGVNYTKHDKSHYVRVNKKVVLSAGSLSSSCILERSGIGERKYLSELKVPLVYENAAVGENLQDHIRSGISFEAAEGLTQPFDEDEAREQFEKDRSGPLGTEAACRAFSYLPLQSFVDDDELKTYKKVLGDSFAQEKPSSIFEKKYFQFIESMLSDPNEATATALLSRRPAFKIEKLDTDDVPDMTPTRWVTPMAMLAYPLSRGSVHIRSTSPNHNPTIRCNYYTHPLDLEVHARIMKALAKIGTSDALKSCLKPNGKRSPAVSKETPLDEIKAYLREVSSTNYHPCGTCAMLPEEAGGVVDTHLKVYGTENLHVVDASIIPVIPRCNIITTVYALAEKAADLLIQDLGLAGGTKH